MLYLIQSCHIYVIRSNSGKEPIYMIQKQKADQKKRLYTLICLVLFIPLVSTGIELVQRTADTHSSILIKLLLVAVMVALFPLSSRLTAAIHVGGRLIAGFISGYRFINCQIGTHMLIREKGKLRFVRYEVSGYGELCQMRPPVPYSAKTPCLLYLSGGLVADILLFGASTYLYLVSQQRPLVAFFALLLAVFSLYTVLINGLPRADLPQNTANLIVKILSQGSARYLDWLQRQVAGLLSDGTRLKDMPAQWLQLPDEIDKADPLYVYIGLLTFDRLIDAMKFEKAAALGSDLLENAAGMTKKQRFSLMMELIFCEVIGQKRDEVILHLMTEEFQMYLKEEAYGDLSLYRIAYAYAHLYSNDEAYATTMLADFEKLAEVYPYSGLVAGERERIAYVMQQPPSPEG